MAKTVTCACGWIGRGETDDDLVAQVMEHAKETHNQVPSRDDILSMAKAE